MTLKRPSSALLLKGFLLLVGLLLASATAQAQEPSPLNRVDPVNVCMVNDRDMKAPQIPIPVGEKTYYGCCKMCVENIQQNEAPRYAVDPVSGKRVDKATAVIGARPDGQVFYFESEETFNKALER